MYVCMYVRASRVVVSPPMMLRVPPNNASQRVRNTESEKESNVNCEWMDDGGAAEDDEVAWLRGILK